jgi:trehalose 6-phosphate phosphatase
MQANTAPSPLLQPRNELIDLALCALLLDVDGTILDIASEPDRVEVPPSLLVSLRALHARMGGALALVSGRRIANLDHLFAPLTLPAIGGHGAEWRPSRDAAVQPNSLAAPGEALKRRVVALASPDPNLIVED